MTLMVKRNLLSAIVLIASVVLAVMFYKYIFARYNGKVWFEFYPVLYLCLGTFVAGVGIYISAILLEFNRIKK